MRRDVWAEINARPSKLRPFGSALAGIYGPDPLATPPLVTVRPIRPRGAGPCKSCGERRYCCECEVAE